MTFDNTQKHNFIAFLWHGFFFALATNFSDINTIIPAILMQAGGSAIHLGVLTAIMIGGVGFMQIFFAVFLAKQEKKKKFLLFAINTRVIALFGISLLLINSKKLPHIYILIFIFLLISLFSFSGAFANISYLDILGKSITKAYRKKFLLFKQTIASIAILASALTVRQIIRIFSYPKNYSLAFLFASSLLFIASLGFWAIKEKPTELKIKFKSFKSVFLEYIRIVKRDRNMRFYLLIINTAGIGLTLIPFYISLAKKSFELSSKSVGNFLLLQILGMILSNILWRFLVKIGSYKLVIKIYAFIATTVPILALILSKNYLLYPFIFLLSGSAISGYKIAIPGIFLEISQEHNRAMYSAISGAGSIATIFFPLVGGIFIKNFGYVAVFFAGIGFILASLFFITKLHCEPTYNSKAQE